MKENRVLETILTRSSVRNYTSVPLTEEEIRVLETAALASPTSLDLQEEKFFFITDKAVLADIEKGVIKKAEENGEYDYIERLKERGNRVIFGAPLLIIIAVNERNNYIDVDAGIAVQSIALAAKSIGLDSVIMAAPDRVFKGTATEDFGKRLGFPNGYRFAIAIAVGRKAQDKTPHTLNYGNIIRI